MRYPLLFERLAVRLGLYPRMVEGPVSSRRVNFVELLI